MTLEELNTVSHPEAFKIFHDTNAAENWVSKMVGARPFATVAAVKDTAEMLWLKMRSEDYLQAFEAHPMIGDVDSLKKKYASTKAVASGEQSGAAGADEAVLQELSDLNHKYLEKFGFIFIVFATGKSAAEMLALLKARIGNARSEEIKNAAAEQLKITLLRIDKLFSL